jgi:D-tyrosyl-tRNA(Tyr) deacylase
MRAILQRVTYGSVAVDGAITGQIDQGLVVLLGVTHSDTPAQADLLALKTAQIRIFDDGEGKMNRSVMDVQGGILVVSQFTLYANPKGGRRPDYLAAARPEQAEPLVARFIDQLRTAGVQRVQSGIFRAMMHVEIHNDGPVTIILDTAQL